ncbi:heterokaryon incompatibility protein-domain-containing protein [Xylariomycetidae sp. FL2044]|nr:heterokaryon incompatibility protein-domain-containing protein [Xylariomycetidae sp. FL2044]
MSKKSAVVQDTSQPLGQTRNRSPNSSIVDSLLEIQNFVVTRDNWIRSLQCLYPSSLSSSSSDDVDEEPSGKRRRLVANEATVASASGTASQLLRRRYINPLSGSDDGRDYVAVSYTWEASDEEEDQQPVGGYRVESRNAGESPAPSEVRDAVWRRVLAFATYEKCPNIWIDRECVEQDDDAEKEAAIQSMHLVYGRSRSPVALLTRTLDSEQELGLLVHVLRGEVGPADEDAALDLLRDITSDKWWTRSWTFQEDYKASTRMTLLMPHDAALEHRKRQAYGHWSNRPLLGTLPGEVCINSANFRRRATEFCLAYRKKHAGAGARVDACNQVLRRAGKYNVLLREDYPAMISRAMSPTIFADVGARDIKEESDRLAIAANVCGYAARLNTSALNRQRSSLSLAMLALYLVNGEILENDPEGGGAGGSPDRDDVYAYLARQSLSSFRPPVGEALTFIKSCRFVDPVLSRAGTHTTGHLWKLGRVIRRPPMRRERYNTLSPLRRLATELNYNFHGACHAPLAVSLLAWTTRPAAPAAINNPFVDNGDEDDDGGGGDVYRGIIGNSNRGSNSNNKRGTTSRRRPWEWREWMADEVETALMEGKALRLGRLVHSSGPMSGRTTGGGGGSDDGDEEEDPPPYLAIFVGETADDWEDEGKRNDEQNEDGDDDDRGGDYVFTSVRPARRGVEGDLPKHVSLEVRVEWSQPGGGAAHHQNHHHHDDDDDGDGSNSSGDEDSDGDADEKEEHDNESIISDDADADADADAEEEQKQQQQHTTTITTTIINPRNSPGPSSSASSSSTSLPPAAYTPPPKLYIKRWVNGLCFFDGFPQREVVFPYPESLL